MATTSVTIINKLGLHARASSKLVQLASQFNAQIALTKGNKSANAKSLMSIMMLVANKGSVLELTAVGVDEDVALKKITELIQHKFGEKE